MTHLESQLRALKKKKNKKPIDKARIVRIQNIERREAQRKRKRR